jgi:ADP-ribose pyrophosphatase
MTGHPSLPGELADGAALRDRPDAWPVVASDEVYASAYLSLSLDTVRTPAGDEVTRAVVRPHGAVGVLALDEEGRVLLVEQYRHPVRGRLLELPAGTLDVDGEGAEDAARRELHEEADLLAEHWESLVAPYATPGYSSERWEVFVATGLSAVPQDERFTREAEEAEIRQLWVPLEDAVAAVLDGRIGDSMTVAGVLAAHARGLGRTDRR